MNQGEQPAENGDSRSNESDAEAREARQSGDSNDRSASPGNDDSLAPLIEQFMSGGSDERSDSPDLEVFKEVAKRHRGRELTAEPIGTELIEAILTAKFPGLSQSQTPEAREEMISQIATAIFDAGELDERLECFWERLCESV